MFFWIFLVFSLHISTQQTWGRRPVLHGWLWCFTMVSVSVRLVNVLMSTAIVLFHISAPICLFFALCQGFLCGFTEFNASRWEGKFSIDARDTEIYFQPGFILTDQRVCRWTTWERLCPVLLGGSQRKHHRIPVSPIHHQNDSHNFQWLSPDLWFYGRLQGWH